MLVDGVHRVLACAGLYPLSQHKHFGRLRHGGRPDLVSVTTPLPRFFIIGSQLIRQIEADGMVRIRDRQDRHFIDQQERMFWINGPETFCELSAKRQKRSGLSFADVLEWKQCVSSGFVSQRFGSILKLARLPIKTMWIGRKIYI